jgi:hypothetical protein
VLCAKCAACKSAPAKIKEKILWNPIIKGF